MKNFYEITVIDIDNKLTVEVELIAHNEADYCFMVNDLLVQSNMTFSFCLLDSLDFKCTVNQGAIEIKKILINDKEIMPLYQHLCDPKTAWVTNNWSLRIPQPFYTWYHEITGQGWIA
jgi:hypothetical protein